MRSAPCRLFCILKNIYFFPFFITLFLFFFFVSPTLAQIPKFNIATTLEISDKEANDGDILSWSTDKTGLIRSSVPYDEHMFGVAVKNPTMVYRTRDTLPVVKEGYAMVNVTTLGGPIKVGDFITSSPIPGKGQKAVDISGYVLGVAMGNFEEKDGTPLEFEKKKIYEGKVAVNLGIGPASPVKVKAAGGVFGTFRFALASLIHNIQTSKETSKIIRYIIAGMVAIATVAINFFTFGKNITKGIESIGRNPLAKVSIQSMIIVDAILIALVSLAGIILSLVIISL